MQQIVLKYRHLVTFSVEKKNISGKREVTSRRRIFLKGLIRIFQNVLYHRREESIRVK